MKKGQSPFVTGIILCLVAVYLAVYFSINGMWNAGTVIAMVMIAGLAGFQFLLHYKFFKQNGNNITNVKNGIDKKGNK